MSALSRREFLTTLGAAGVVAASSGWFTRRLFAMAEEGTLRAPRGPGVERWVPTLCRMCPAGCGLRVRLVDGLPVGLEGDRTNPLSAGGLCPAGFAGLQELVHPDRVRTPLRRDGPRGSGRWTPVSWDEALEQIAAPLRASRAEGRPQAFAVLERGDSPLTLYWLERVLRAHGSPNLVVDATGEPWRSAWATVAGTARPPAPDLANADFVLSFGHESLETDGHPVWQTKTWGRLRAPIAARQASAAYVGPRMSPTANHADLKVAVRPGTEAIMALGLVHVLILEDLADRSFLDRLTRGYHDRPGGSGAGGDGFEAYVRSRFGLEEVSRLTGAPVSEIFRLGRAFGTSRRPLALAGPGALSGEIGFATAMAVIALNLAVGAMGRTGGYVASGGAPLDLPPPEEPDQVARRGLSSARVDGAGWATLPLVRQSPAGLAANLAARRPYPLEVLLVHGVNPVHEWPGGKTIEEALAAVGLVAVVGAVADETARVADLILPEASFLEAWQILPPATGIPFDYAGLQQPVLEPIYQSRAFEDMWFDLARRIGGPAAAAVPAGSYADWLPSAAAGLHRAGRGTIAGGPFHARVAGFMEERGWKAPGPQTAEAFWEEFRRSGSWVDAPRGEHSPAELLGDRAERFDLWPERLLADARKLTGTPVADDALYGGARAAAAGAAGHSDHPLHLLLFDTSTLWAGRTALTPVLLEMSGFREDIGWDSWVEIHPETARRGRIQAGDRVRLESPAGSLIARARITPVVPPDAVAMPRGLGHRHFGRFATGVGVNPLALVAPALDRWTGNAILETRVRLTRMPA
ncbi:MAG: molybdopterin-dependent oxidoreductase [Candidatus Eisenbacteria bacterium]|nr:molybdopterin-dependent oxidoreductase [Candidatus Eisenbacteria bacterium]